MYYFALLLPLKEGGYMALFPDFPEAFTHGETLEECMDMARDVLAVTLEEYAAARRPLPRPCSPERARAALAEAAGEDGIDADRAAMTQLFKAPAQDARPVKLNISMTRGALAAIDEKARRLGMTRSGFLVRAALAHE